MFNSTRYVGLIGSLVQTISKRRNVVENIFWLSANKAIAIVDGIIVGAMVAKYLGPAKLGMIALATSLSALLVAVTSFGSDAVIVRELVQQKQSPGKIYWSMFWFRAGLSVLLLAITTFALIVFLGAGHIGGEEFNVLLIVCLTILSSPLQLGRLVLEAKVLVKWYVWAANAVLLASAIIRCLLVYYSFEVAAFAASQVVTIFVTSIAVLYVARSNNVLPKIEKPNFELIKSYARECWPTMISVTCMAVYMNADVAILSLLMSNEDVGLYSVGTRFTAVWHFIPVAITTTLFPSMTSLRYENAEAYFTYLRKLFDIIATLAIVTMLISYIAFPAVIYSLLGMHMNEAFLYSLCIV